MKQIKEGETEEGGVRERVRHGEIEWSGKRGEKAKAGEKKKDRCGKRERQIKWAGMRDLSTLKASEICEACGL